jgi:hypothetical protein
MLLNITYLSAQVSYEEPPRLLNQGTDLKLFVDCSFCDELYFSQELKNVDIVRDAKLADVHLLFLSQQSGNGGQLQKIQFIGLGEFKHLSDIMKYAIAADMSDDEKRQTQLHYLELGLLRFRIEAGQSNDILIHVTETEAPKEMVEKDPWNYWVFSLNANGWFSGQETTNSISYNGSANARRITEKNKFIMRGGINESREIFKYDTVKTISVKKSAWADVKEVISINDHWSYGFFGNAGNSLFRNYKFYGVGKVGVEYDLFKYSESFNKQAIIAYNAGARYNSYHDTTVFNRLEDVLAFHEVTIGGTIKQNWGNFSSTITYQNYLNDFSLNSVSFWLNFKVRLFKGFSWRVNGSFDILHNQVNIAKSNASIEDILLQQQELGSGYSYWMNTGINYSFGSMYNSVVNPRFDI